MTESKHHSEGSKYPVKAIEALFAGALERPAGPPRDQWLRHAAGGDENLLAEVHELLGAHTTSGDFLEKSVLLGITDPLAPANEALIDAQIGTHLGPYELVELLGEGGFGSVFRARQTQPVRREVALKVIKLGMDTRQVIARFEAERQALAVLDHPSIARVLDAGATESGRPYFVMDLASGRDLTHFCDDERLTIPERCRVFVELCQAVQHAHQRGIIHRDLKPSNVLASRHEGRPFPKVIDFGIAKATGEDVADASMFTELGQIIGTPIYMSPEQATGSADIDIRADVYSLGVILYELLVGVTPLSSDDLRASSHDLAAFLQDFEAPAPSQRLGTLGDKLPAVAAARGASLSELKSAVRGDLDHIALCAMESVPDERYESAAALARDVQRALENRPIEARPPSPLRRSGKFMRRHRVAVGAAAAVLVAAIAGISVSISSLRSKRDQGIVLQNVLETASNATATGELDITAEDIERQIARAFSEDAPILVDALATFSDRRRRQGAIAEALDAQRRALARATSIHGEDAGVTDLTRASLGLQLADAGERAEAAHELASAVEADSRRFPPGTPAFNRARTQLVQLLLNQDDLARAESVAATADEIARTAGSEDMQLRVEALDALVQVRTRSGDTTLARNTWRTLMDTYDDAFSDTSLVVPRKRIQFSNWLLSVGDSASAARAAKRVLTKLDAMGDVPRDLRFSAVRALNDAALDAPLVVNREEAIKSFEQEVDLARGTYGKNSAAFVESLKVAANRSEQLGNMAKALELRCERFKLVRARTQKANDFARSGLLGALSEELGKGADSICRRDGLDGASYVAAREAIELALELNPEDGFLLEAQLILMVRTRDIVSVYAKIQKFQTVTGMVGEHPLSLALEAIGYSLQRNNMTLARSKLEQALTLAREPQFVSTPRLHETLGWAKRTLGMTE
jgi:serine/threonine protein kinase